ncbi:MAG: O-antigen ligase family protein [Nostocales cyanobacterium 94392]|nr:O-antigen ligase family protein [Nostocales cyanobacterium 94392]
MQLKLQDKLIRLAIYLLPFTPFAFQNKGLGIIEPSLPIILFVLALFGSQKYTINKLVLGNKKSANAVIFFLCIALISTFISVYFENFYSINKSIGVLISLLVFFSAYYTFSAVNVNPYKSGIFFNDFMNVSLFVASTVIIEFIIKKVLGQNYFYEIINSIHAFLPYSAPKWIDVSILDRYKGILKEPGDVGFFAIPAFTASISAFMIDKKNAYTLFRIFFFTLSILLTNSTTNYFLLILIICFILINNNKNTKNVKLFKKIIYGIFGLIFSTVVVILIITQFQSYFPLIIQDRIANLTNFFKTQYYDNTTNLSVQVILNSYNSAIYSLQKNPLFGVGLGNIAQSYEVVALARGIDTRLNQHDGYSMFLRLLTEVGVVGCVAFLYVFWSRLTQSLKFIKYIHEYLIHFKDKNQCSELYKSVLMINSAGVSSLLYALVNRPTYWNLVIPLLFGLCSKASFTIPKEQMNLRKLRN